MVTAFDVQSTYVLAYIHYLGLCFMPAPSFHLGLVFPDRKPILDRFPVLKYLIYLPGVFLAILLGIYLFNFDDILNTKSLAWLPGYVEIGAVARLYAIFCAIQPDRLHPILLFQGRNACLQTTGENDPFRSDLRVFARCSVHVAGQPENHLFPI